MFGRAQRAKVDYALAQVSAQNASQAVIQFDLDGTILDANEIFLRLVGYSLAEIKGQNHRLFVSQADQGEVCYLEFWAALRRGENQTADFKRIAKNGTEIWIHGTYIVLRDRAGKPWRVTKVATDVSAQKIRTLEDAGLNQAVRRAQAVIEFDLAGTVMAANQNFLTLMGYSLSEIQGKPHSIFVDQDERSSSEYRAFWRRLGEGEYQAAEYKRLGKAGKEVWILATYNPIFDDQGKPFKVVKLATDVTAERLRKADIDGQIAAIGKSQAVIEFAMDGSILTANDNFLRALGYTLTELKGKHHSMFVEATERNAASYQQFWAALNKGDFQASEYKRIGKGGREVWIQATYNPILDLNGRPFKVVKFATDTTAQVVARLKSERVRSMMESVAAGAEELNASVREIAEAMTKSKETAMTAVANVEAADERAQRLSIATQAMGGIVELIGNITGQINLLALNATIESARAGEAGRGFAVVASEVKSLANQAKQATDKITEEISGLNSISGEVVQGLEAIKKSIQDVSEYVTSTAVAVEEQSAVTNEMSSSMQRAAAEAAA